MTGENVETIRAALAALTRGDLDAALKDMSPEFEFDFSRSVGTVPGVYGLDEMPGFWNNFAEAWESVRMEAEEFIEAGDQVVTPITTHARGRQGVEVQARGAWVWTFRGGSIARICFYQELQEAFEAAGLSHTPG